MFALSSGSGQGVLNPNFRQYRCQNSPVELIRSVSERSVEAAFAQEEGTMPGQGGGLEAGEVGSRRWTGSTRGYHASRRLVSRYS